MDTLKRLINLLREELKNYGEMLARLDHQQELVLHRSSDDLLASVASVQAQAAAIQQARALREQMQLTLARELVLDAPTFSQLIRALPADYQPLVSALVDENNELLIRVQQRARQNHLLLARSMESMQRLINSLIPAPATLVYNGIGHRAPPSFPAQAALLEVVG
jgi:flagellar biosynthesis/type III secretory pathway chaperone